MTPTKTMTRPLGRLGRQNKQCRSNGHSNSDIVRAISPENNRHYEQQYQSFDQQTVDTSISVSVVPCNSCLDVGQYIEAVAANSIFCHNGPAEAQATSGSAAVTVEEEGENGSNYHHGSVDDIAGNEEVDSNCAHYDTTGMYRGLCMTSAPGRDDDVPITRRESSSSSKSSTTKMGPNHCLDISGMMDSALTKVADAIFDSMSCGCGIDATCYEWMNNPAVDQSNPCQPYRRL